jgi:hypothetical protein
MLLGKCIDSILFHFRALYHTKYCPRRPAGLRGQYTIPLKRRMRPRAHSHVTVQMQPWCIRNYSPWRRPSRVETCRRLVRIKIIHIFWCISGCLLFQYFIRLNTSISLHVGGRVHAMTAGEFGILFPLRPRDFSFLHGVQTEKAYLALCYSCCRG